MKQKVLVAGFATRHIAQSAFAAGYEVYAIDHFCDQDLRFYAKEAMGFDELGELEGAVAEMCERHTPDLIVAASGAEALATRDLCGTPRDKVERFLDKLSTHRFFEETGVPAPGLLSQGIYPAMIKPRKGSGGWRNAIVRDNSEFSRLMEKYDNLPFLSEEVVAGVPNASRIRLEVKPATQRDCRRGRRNFPTPFRDLRGRFPDAVSRRRSKTPNAFFRGEVFPVGTDF